MLLLFCATLSANQERRDENSATASAETEQLATRVEKFWQTRIDNDTILAYDYEEVKARNQQSLQEYVNTPRQLIIKTFKLLNTEITGKDTAVANLMIEFQIPGFAKPIKGPFADKWIFIDGQWYHHIKEKPYIRK